MDQWNHVHTDHAYITEMGLLLILVDSFSGWPKVICVPDKKSSMIKQILRVIFSRNDIPKTLVSENAPYKTPRYHPPSNGFAERMVQTIKIGLKHVHSKKNFLPKLLLSYHTIPHAGRQIRAPLIMSYSTNEKMWYKKNKESNPERAEFMQKGHNTAIINKKKKGEQYISPCRSNKAPG